MGLQVTVEDQLHSGTNETYEDDCQNKQTFLKLDKDPEESHKWGISTLMQK